MIIRELTDYLEQLAPLALQESYDNCGLLVGSAQTQITRALITLDCTEDVIREAIDNGCNLVIAHHPIVFSGLKKFNGNTYIERTVILAIQHHIAIYAIHTNLDNIQQGVNSKIAQKLGLLNCRILEPKNDTLLKLVTFVPLAFSEVVRKALFDAGAGHIGNYSECSFSVLGSGSFKAGLNTNPYAGAVNESHKEEEVRIETVFPGWLKNKVLTNLSEAHPYEEVAYDLYALKNAHIQTGSGLYGNLAKKMNSEEFLAFLKEKMELTVIKYTDYPGEIDQVAICGGSGSFLLNKAISVGSQVFISSDFKYHQYFDAEKKLMIADIGHYESEKFTKSLLSELILEKFPTFALLLSKSNTNPVNYYI